MAKKKTTKRKTTKKVAKPKVLSRVKYQTAVKRSNKRADSKVKALPPGKRRSKSGKVYTETRVNRSDRNSKKRL